MKKTISAILLSSFMLAIFYGCKKEDIDSQSFVKQQILGKWPLKYQVKTVYTDGISAKPDTLLTYDPIDTLVFTAEGMAIKRNKTVISSVGYEIDATGDNITFNYNPAVNLRITFVRNYSIGLGSQVVSNVGGREIRTVIDDHYVKN